MKGVFENCSLEHADTLPTCVSRLDKAKSMGFGLVLNRIRGTDPDVVRSYALAAQRRGLRLGWDLSDSSWWTAHDAEASNVLDAYRAWIGPCGCKTNRALLNSLIGTLASFPNSWGWYIADDTSLLPGTVPAVRAWNRRLKSLAPSMKTVVGIYRRGDLDRYRGAADYLAQESYPFGLPSSRRLQRGVAPLARYTEARTGDSAFILQAFSWGANIWDTLGASNCTGLRKFGCMKRLKYPTAREMIWQKHTVLRNARPRLLLWYGLHDTLGFYPPLEDPDGNYNQPGARAARVRAERLRRAVTSVKDPGERAASRKKKAKAPLRDRSKQRRTPSRPDQPRKK